MRTLRALACVALILCVGAAMAAGPVGGWGQNNTNFASATGYYGASDQVYDNTTYAWMVGGTTGSEHFTVTADVEMWMSMHFNATDIYFHIGSDLGANTTMSTEIGGGLTSNNGQYLFITKRDAPVTAASFNNLILTNDVLNRVPTTKPTIPVKWYLKDTTTNEGRYTEGSFSAGGNNGQEQGIMWLLDGGTTGDHPFTIKCEITPDRYQPDGHYEMDPVLAASPVL